MFASDYKNLARANDNFRQVLQTGPHSQIVAMCISEDEDIGEEVHDDTDQIFMIAEGYGRAEVGGEARVVKEGALVFVPAGTAHNITNTGNQDLKLLTIYAPPEHPDGTIHKTKQEATA
jgi:mannose-6-phosphate isomerase-like protein (cupin superfamily)